jgi:hypothetical protein
VVLSGEDAGKFERQVKYGRVSAKAQDALNRGDELLRQFGERKLGDDVMDSSPGKIA